ncbi:putative auxin-responsive protein SAUR71-like [Sesbania bispinosa]|nr:putative auxin-responsive protein SAUR71-like [Sesbania bispinosa]
MEVVRGKLRKNVISKAWERWRSSLGGGTGNKWSQLKGTNYSENDYDENEKGRQIAPHGCFSVYVGPQKQSPARLLCHKHRGRLSAYSVMDSEMLKISRFE